MGVTGRCEHPQAFVPLLPACMQNHPHGIVRCSRWQQGSRCATSPSETSLAMLSPYPSCPYSESAVQSSTAACTSHALQNFPLCTSHCRYLPSTDTRLEGIKPYAHSPVNWFRNPYVHLLLVSRCSPCAAAAPTQLRHRQLAHPAAQADDSAGLPQVSCDDPDEYKRSLRGQLRALLEREKDPLGPAEWVVCHVKQATPSDGLLKGPRKVWRCLYHSHCPCAQQHLSLQSAASHSGKQHRAGGEVFAGLAPQVFEALRHDFNTRRRERCVRLDLPYEGRGSITGLEDLERFLKDAVKASYEARQAAYEEEVRRPLHGAGQLLRRISSCHCLTLLRLPLGFYSS